MPRLREETIGAGDQSWLGSTHGIYNCRTVAPSSAEFTISAYPTGTVPSGTPIAVVDGLAVPYDDAGNDGSEIHAGFLFTDQPVATGAPAEGGWPLFDHGRVNVDKLPVDFDPTAEGFESTGQFVYLGTGA